MSPEIKTLTDVLTYVADEIEDHPAYPSYAINADDVRNAALKLEQQEIEIEQLRAKVERVEKIIGRWRGVERFRGMVSVGELRAALAETKEQA